MSSSAEVAGVPIDKADKEMFGPDDGGPITKVDLAKYYFGHRRGDAAPHPRPPHFDAAVSRRNRRGVVL